MAFFVDPSFFIVLFVSVVVAAVLGLSERPLAPWGMVVSALLLAGLFWGEVAQLVALALFVALAHGGTWAEGAFRSLGAPRRGSPRYL